MSNNQYAASFNPSIDHPAWFAPDETMANFRIGPKRQLFQIPFILIGSHPVFSKTTITPRDIIHFPGIDPNTFHLFTIWVRTGSLDSIPITRDGPADFLKLYSFAESMTEPGLATLAISKLDEVYHELARKPTTFEVYIARSRTNKKYLELDHYLSSYTYTEADYSGEDIAAIYRGDFSSIPDQEEIRRYYEPTRTVEELFPEDGDTILNRILECQKRPYLEGTKEDCDPKHSAKHNAMNRRHELRRLNRSSPSLTAPRPEPVFASFR